MRIEDLTELPRDVDLTGEVCLVGSGPAAWTLAKELSDARIRVLVLESGGSRIDAETDTLNEVEDIGMPLFNGRHRVFGGTTEAPGWRNRCRPFDAIDHEQRPWVPHSGWPFGEETVAPYLGRAARYLGTAPLFLDAGMPPSDTGVVRAKVDDALLTHVFWGFGREWNKGPTRFGRSFRALGSRFVRVIQHATVTHLTIDPDTGQMASVEIADPAGHRRSIAARCVVLCAGGIENARLLLASNRQVSAGLGNRFDLVGRFLMDHPRDLNMALTIDPNEAAKVRRIVGGFHVRGTSHLPYPFIGGFALSPRLQREEGLLNCAAWPEETPHEDDPVVAAMRLIQGAATDRAADLRRVAAGPGHVARAFRAQMIRRQPVYSLPKTFGFLIASEQVPNPDSRVSLSDRRDRFGEPLARTDWRVGRAERASQGRLATTIAAEFKRLGLPEAKPARWIEEEAWGDGTVLQDGCHPTGTTRLATEPAAGVVDPHCQVFGVGGLFVAGSSVFPTAGHANPTLMIVAMACRLADHLKTRVAARGVPHEPAVEATVSAPPLAAPQLAPGTRVAVTGGNGFIGGRLVERLAEQGAVVTCLNRGSSNARVRRTGAKALSLDLADADAARAALDGVQVVFHCAYDWNDDGWNHRALASLIAAATAHRCERFVHVSSFVVYNAPSAGEITEVTEETSADGGYARTKRAMELALLKAHREAGLPCAILQPTVVYGPHSKPWTVDPAERLRFGTVVLPAPGDGICPAVHVDDVVEAMLICASHPRAVGERFLVSGPDVVTWGQFYESLATAIGVAGPRYEPFDDIDLENKRTRKLRRLLTSPETLLRRGANIGPVRRAATRLLPKLPAGLSGELEDRLYGPATRQRGHVHWPEPGSAHWMTGKSVIRSDKARRRLGYLPRITLQDGMASLRPYLSELLSR